MPPEWRRAMPSEPTGRAGFSWLVWVIVLAPVLYVLSIGPAAAVVSRTGTGHDAVSVVYYPLGWLHDNTPLRDPLDWYLELWGPK